MKVTREQFRSFYQSWIAPNKIAIALAIISLLTFVAVGGIDSWLTHRADRRFDQAQTEQRERETALIERAAKAEARVEARDAHISELKALARDYEKQIEQLHAETQRIDGIRQKVKGNYENDKKYIQSIASDAGAVRSELRARLERLGYIEKEER